MAQKLKFGNGTWATKKGSTLAYNDENNNYKPLPFSFTRDSIATRVNKEGLIEVVGKDKPRIDYTDSGNGNLLLEPSRTNLITYSSELTNSSWAKTNSGTGSAPIITSNYSISPDGTQNADRVIFNLNGGTANGDVSQVSITLGGVSSASYTNSVYIKSNTANDYDLVVTDPSGGHITKNISTQWQRFDNSRENVTNVSIRIRLRGDESTSDYADVSIWGAQVEQGSYPTSYIPTSGSTVQRAAETANGAGNAAMFNGLQGVLMAQISALDSNPNTYRAIYLNDTNATRYVGMRYTPSSNVIQILGFDGSNFVSQNFTLLDSKLNTKISVKYSSEGLVIWVNGFKLSTLSGFTGMGANDLNELVFRSNNLQPFYGKTKELGYYDTVLADEELEYLTSYRSLNELVTELNLNTL